jgi:hypothetical protein
MRVPRSPAGIRSLLATSLLLPLWSCQTETPTQRETLDALLAGQCAYESICGTSSSQAACDAQLELGWWGKTPQLAPITTSTVNEADYPVTLSNVNSPAALLAAVQAGQVQLDNAEAAACITGLNAAPCSVPPTAATLHACASMYVGTVPVGESCIASPSCVKGSVCVPAGVDTRPCAATCQPITPGTCQSALHCAADEICVNGKCAAIIPPGGEGEPCGNQIPCSSGLLHCETTVCQDGKLVSLCERPVPPGQNCYEYGTCGGKQWFSNGNCNEADWCVGVTEGSGTCLAPVNLHGNCSVIDECRGGYCSSGTCVAFPSSGACSPPPLYGCSGGSYCDMSGPPTCRPFKLAGEPCSDNRECSYPLVCLDPGNGGTICAPTPVPGMVSCSL